MSYRLAPMSTPIAVLTALVLIVPLVLIAVGLALVGLIVAGLYLGVWLWMRPRRFVIDDRHLTIEWPLRSRRIRRAEIGSARIIEPSQFRRDYGWGVRIGVGGLWGGFGLLWTRPSTFDMYVSRTDGLVIVERTGARPLLITPELPEEFARSLQPR